MRARPSFLFVSALAMASACAGSATQPAAVPRSSGPPRAVDRGVIVSIDGLRPVDCARLPTLGLMAREGAFAAPPDGALSVVPSVTYPAHTTIVTGVRPNRHGITTNLAPDSTFDRANKDGWRWYREDVRSTTLYDVALDAGLRTALVTWPATVGARATVLLPEFWRAGTADDVKLMRQLATPGLLDQVAQRFPRFTELYAKKEATDPAYMDVAITALDAVKPHLLLLHIADVDSAQHEFGPDSPEADTALLAADAEIKRLLDALRAMPEWDRTVLAIVSDHGFMRVSKRVAPLVHVESAGLGERVWMNGGGALAYFYLTSENDTEAAKLTWDLLTRLAADPESGVGTLLQREQIVERGGDPDAFAAFETTPGFSLSRERTGAAVTETEKLKGMHGYFPERPEMRATTLFYGPMVVKGVLRGARLIDIAPTVAAWLGLQLPNTEGAPLAVQLSPRR